MADQDLDAALANLAQIKDEHREILHQIASDPGMAPETRASLIAHLYAEEDEHLAEIRALRAGDGGPPSATSGAPAARCGLTVGSLRRDPAPVHPRMSPHLSVGSLRT